MDRNIKIMNYKNKYNSTYLGCMFVALAIFGTVYNYLVPVRNWVAYDVQNIASLTFLSIYIYICNRSDLRSCINFTNILIAAFLLYWVIGASLLSFADEDLIKLKLKEYYVEPIECFTVNNYNYLGFGLTLLIAKIVESKLVKNSKESITFYKSEYKISIIIIVTILLSAKLYNSLLNLVPSYNITNYGIIGLLSIGSSGLIALLIYKNNKIFDTIAVLFALIYSYIGILEANKTNIVIPILILMLSYALRYNNKLIIFVGVLIVFLVINKVYPYTNVMRIEGINNMDLRERMEMLKIVHKKINEKNEDKVKIDNTVQLEEFNKNNLNSEQGYSIWYRLCYVTEQVAAMKLYENGSESIEKILDIPWLFIPRFFYNQKPKLSNEIGPTLYYKMTGFRGSSSSPGIYVGGYYRDGDRGFLINTISFGIVLGICESILVAIRNKRIYYLIPTLFILIWIPLKIDGNLVVDIIGNFIATISILFFFIIIIQSEKLYGKN